MTHESNHKLNINCSHMNRSRELSFKNSHHAILKPRELRMVIGRGLGRWGFG